MGTYSPPVIGRWFFLALFGILGVTALAVVISAFAGGENAVPAPFALFWLGALGWNAYWWLFRIVHSLRLQSGVLEWQAPLRSGRLPVPEITSIRSITLMPNVVAIRRLQGRPLLILPGKGLPGFLAEVAQAGPEIDVRLSRWARLADRVPGASAWRPDK